MHPSRTTPVAPVDPFDVVEPAGEGGAA
jgi:hypothetical protein